MPREGFRSITVRDEVYEDFFKMYKAFKPSLFGCGIYSYAGFITLVLRSALDNKNVWNAILDDVEKKLEVSLENVRRIKQTETTEELLN